MVCWVGLSFNSEFHLKTKKCANNSKSTKTKKLKRKCFIIMNTVSGVPRNFVPGGGFQKIQLRTEDRENGDLGAVAR